MKTAAPENSVGDLFAITNIDSESCQIEAHRQYNAAFANSLYHRFWQRVTGSKTIPKPSTSFCG
jgi:hypothetical protein